MTATTGTTITLPRPGSSISWSGSPLDATVDITAIYRTKTSPADLLSNELAGAAASELTAYRKLLTFDECPMQPPTPVA